jgi:transcription initiation factor TFIIIB Brf1 subunit/transcription initiation factor TFIIB
LYFTSFYIEMVILEGKKPVKKSGKRTDKKTDKKPETKAEIKANDLITNICDQIGFGFPLESKIVKAKIYDPFDIPEIDDDIEIDLKKNADDNLRIKQSSSSTNVVICLDCNGEMFRSSRGMECECCGRIEDDIGNDIDIVASESGNSGNGSSDIINSYNTSDSSATPIRISGPNNYIYQKKLVSNTSNYKKTQKKTTNDQMINFVYQFKGSTPPKNVVLEAAELYYSVQQHCIKRGEVRKGTMAACLYRICIIHNITRKPKEISDIFGIPQSELSNGEKILDELVASGLIKVKEPTTTLVDQDEQQMHAFLNRYFESLNIPVDEDGIIPVGRPNYKEFAHKLIKFTRKYRIAESSIMSSKCAGAVYILSNKRKELQIKRDTIERECAISKSTFSRFSQAVFNVLISEEEKNKKIKSRLRKLFKNYQIPVQ